MPLPSRTCQSFSADPYLDALLITYCEEVLSRRETPPSTFRSNVENAIAVLLPYGKPKASEIARRLGISQRTLATRLSSEGLTYGGVLSDLRYELAKRGLREQRLSISQMADRANDPLECFAIISV